MVSVAAKDRVKIPFSTRATPLRHRAWVWVLMLPILYFAPQGKFSFYAGGDAEGILGKVLLPLLAYGIILYALLTRGSAVLQIMLRMKWIMLLALMTIASTLWSQDPLRSASNGVLYLLDTLFAFYLVASFDPEEQMTFVMISGAVVATVGLVIILVLPQFGLDQSARTPNAWRGLFEFRTGNALAMTFLLSPALVLGRKDFQYRRFFYLALLGISIVRAQVASAVLVLAGFCLFLILLRLSYRIERRSLAILALTGLPFLAVALAIGSAEIPLIFKVLGRDPTLTGRTVIWASLFQSIAKHPLLGYGYRAFWLGLTGESANAQIAANWIFGYAHNGILEVALQLGLVGVLLFFITFVQAVRNACICYRRDRTPATEWYFGLLVLTVLYNISEETVVWPSMLLSILYIIACTGLATAARQVRAQPQLQFSPIKEPVFAS